MQGLVVHAHRLGLVDRGNPLDLEAGGGEGGNGPAEEGRPVSEVGTQ
jgi:hypothetical protein